jgi:hypothetical protein
MKKMFWYKTCPFCNQGRLFIFKNLSINKLYLHCEECERGYYDPQQINVENSFLTLQEEFEAVNATYDDLQEHKWETLRINTVNE